MAGTTYVRYGDGVKDPAAVRPASSIDAEGAVRCAYSKVTAAADEQSGSTHILARLPSNARILPASTIFFAALTGITTYGIGLGVAGAVVNSKTSTLNSGLDIHTAGNAVIGAALAAGSRGKKLWDLAGYTSDPGGMIDIIGTTGADASAGGAIEAFIVYAKP